MYYKSLSKIEESIPEKIVDAAYLTCLLLKMPLKELYYNLWCLRVWFVAERLQFRELRRPDGKSRKLKGYQA